MDHIKKHFDVLGLKVRDKVTGVEGIATSLSFDLYGCVQVCINRGVDKDGKHLDQWWYDIARITPLSDVPVMRRPDYLGDNQQAAGLQGPADKPSPHSA